MSFGLLQVFHVELVSSHRISNWITMNSYNNLTLIYPVIVNRIGIVFPCGSNKGLSSRFCVDSRIRHETPEEGRRTYWSKRCEYINKDVVNSQNILRKNNYQALSQIILLVGWVCFLWHIKHCWLFNAKSIFIQKTVLFQTIQFNLSTQFKYVKNSISSYSV